MCLVNQAKWDRENKDKFQKTLSFTGLQYPYRAWVKFLKIRIQPNTTTTLNIHEMVTFSQMQQVTWIPLAQLIFNQLCTMVRTKQVVRPCQIIPGGCWRRRGSPCNHLLPTMDMSNMSGCYQASKRGKLKRRWLEPPRSLTPRCP